MTTHDRDRLAAQLRNAERRLAEAERAQINTASAQHSGFAGSDQGRGNGISELNNRIADATGVHDLRAEVARLRSELGAGASPGARRGPVRQWVTGITVVAAVALAVSGRYYAAFLLFVIVALPAAFERLADYQESLGLQGPDGERHHRWNNFRP